MNKTLNNPNTHDFTSPSTRPWFFLAIVWILLDLILLFVATNLLRGAFPIFAFVWLIIPFIVVLLSRNARKIGFHPVRWRELAKYTILCLVGSLALMAIFEPWSHAYRTLLSEALSSAQPDTTFAWLVRFPGSSGVIGMFLYTVLVTIFAEELFFRGWLLQWLLKGMPALWSILLQALLFTLPQALVALFLSPTQVLVYLVIDSFLAIGVVGGWAAWRTRSIWPSLISAALLNLVMVLILK